MKKLLPAFGAAHAEEIYDPQHTMLALNMAIVSVHRILATQDRIIFEQEYQNIINNLSLGNIESDKDMTALYSDLTCIISRKRLPSDEAEFLRSHYDQRERKSGRPTKGKVHKISLSIPLELYEGIEFASYFFRGNITAYINSLIRLDLERNLDKYQEFRTIMEEMNKTL